MGAEGLEELIPTPGAVSQMISREMFLQKFWRDGVERTLWAYHDPSSSVIPSTLELDPISSSPVVSRSSMGTQQALSSLFLLHFQSSSPAPNATFCPEMELLMKVEFWVKGEQSLRKVRIPMMNGNFGKNELSGSCFHSSRPPKAH